MELCFILWGGLLRAADLLICASRSDRFWCFQGQGSKSSSYSSLWGQILSWWKWLLVYRDHSSIWPEGLDSGFFINVLHLSGVIRYIKPMVTLILDAGNGWCCSTQPNSKAVWMSFSPFLQFDDTSRSAEQEMQCHKERLFYNCSSLTAIKMAGKRQTIKDC